MRAVELRSSPWAALGLDRPRLVVLVSLTHGVTEFFGIVVPPLFPFMVPALDASYAELTLLVVTYFVVASVGQLVVGPVADDYDPRRLLAGGTAALALGIGAVAFARGLPPMVAGMALAGVGGSVYHPTGMSLISDAESAASHGRSMGIHGALGAAGTVAAPLVAVSVASVAGWRAALVVASGLGLCFAAALYVVYPRVAGTPEAGPTLREVVTTSFGTDVAERAGCALASLRSPRVLALVALFAVVGGEIRAIQTFLPSFVVAATGGREAVGGELLAVTMTTAGVASIAAGWLVDRWNRHAFLAACFAATGVVVAALGTVPGTPTVLAVGVAVLGLAMYAAYPAANAIAATASDAGTSGSLFAVTNTAAALGAAAFPSLLGLVADAAGVRTAFLATAGVSALGVLVAAATRRS